MLPTWLPGALIAIVLASLLGRNATYLTIRRKTARPASMHPYQPGITSDTWTWPWI